jgi:hypothetical protein
MTLTTSSTTARTTLDTAMKANGALQQVFARCAEPVWRLADKFLTETEASPIKTARGVAAAHRPSASSSISSNTSTSPTAVSFAAGLHPDLPAFLAQHQLGQKEALIKALAALEVESMADVEFGLKEQILTAAKLIAQGAGELSAARFIAVAKTVGLWAKGYGMRHL